MSYGSAYFDVDLAIVWNTVTVDFPAVVRVLEGERRLRAQRYSLDRNHRAHARRELPYHRRHRLISRS